MRLALPGAAAFFLVVLAGVTVPAQSDVTDTDLAASSGGRTIRLGAVADGRVTILPLEVYVSRVLAGEADPRAGDAAQQALAIAIRTYTLKNANRHARDGYDLCDSTHCQVPRASTPLSRRAAMATAGQVLMYRGSLAEVFYSASCGGRSERAADVWPGADYPYLVSRGDDVCERDPAWTTTFTLEDVRTALARVGFEGTRLRRVEIESRTSSGRVARLRLAGLRPDVIAGDQFRLAVGATILRSTAFDLRMNGDTIELTGHGFGHGVGMCVIGAGRRAGRGESAREILAQYYPGLDITSLAALPLPIETAAVTPPPRPAASAPAPRPSTPAPSPPRPAPPADITIILPASSPVAAGEIQALVMRARADLARTLGVASFPMTVRLHDSLDSFRLATNRPWWVGEVANGGAIDLAPSAMLTPLGGLEGAVRVAVAQLLVGETFAGRPAWVHIGAARHFAHPMTVSASTNISCPSDAELTLAVSAAAQREAEARAEQCFARQLDKAGDWRRVR